MFGASPYCICSKSKYGCRRRVSDETLPCWQGQQANVSDLQVWEVAQRAARSITF
jgi:hypothetical protein